MPRCIWVLGIERHSRAGGNPDERDAPCFSNPPPSRGGRKKQYLQVTWLFVPLLDTLTKHGRIQRSVLAFCVVFFDRSVFGSVANIEGIGSLFDDSKGMVPAFVWGIAGCFFLPSKGRVPRVWFHGGRKLNTMNIYVGNLAYRKTEDDLRQQFEQYGTVSRVDIISDRETGRSKGFGFVEMPNSSEASAAIQALDGMSVGERTLKVNEARERAPRGQGGGGGGYGGGGGRSHRDRDRY